MKTATATTLLLRKPAAVAAAVALLTVGSVGSVDTALANATGSFQVSVTIQAACTLTTPSTAISFGTVTAGTSTTLQNGASSLSVLCPSGQAFNIGLLPTNTGGTVNGTGDLLNGTTTIGYQLFSNAGYSTVWGNTVGSNTVAHTSTSSVTAFTQTIYAQVPGGNIAAADAAGTYTDTVDVTVYY
jgi:spore coat protein U-like protein